MSALRNLQEKIRRLELGIGTAQTEVDNTNCASERNTTVCDKSTETSLGHFHSLTRHVNDTALRSSSTAPAGGYSNVTSRGTHEQRTDQVLLVTPECLNEGRVSVG